MSSRRGRPSKLTPEVQHRIVQALAGGNTRAHAALYGGVSYQTFKTWMSKGRQQKRGRYRTFLAAVKRTEAEAAVRNLAIIQKSAQGGSVVERTTVTRPSGETIVKEKVARPEWQASAWYLERRHPQAFARRSAEHLSPAEVVRLATRIAGLDREQIPPEKQEEFLRQLDGLLGELDGRRAGE